MAEDRQAKRVKEQKTHAKEWSQDRVNLTRVFSAVHFILHDNSPLPMFIPPFKFDLMSPPASPARSTFANERGNGRL